MAYLVIVDRGYRGSAEAQFFDALYGVQMLGDQLGGMDVVLRGTTVTAALADAGPLPELRVGPTVLIRRTRDGPCARWWTGGGRLRRPAGAGGLRPGRRRPAARITRLDTAHLAHRWGTTTGCGSW